jgi:LmbE family N-acetylglucosaminyl deacetylase
MKTRILCIHAHPDDAELLAARSPVSRPGPPVIIATMTAGDCGSAEFNAAEVSAIHDRAARAAASSG